MFKVIQFQKRPKDYLGKAIKVFLKEGGAFNFKVTGCGQDHISGFDDEFTDLTIAIADIDYIVGG